MNGLGDIIWAYFMGIVAGLACMLALWPRNVYNLAQRRHRLLMTIEVTAMTFENDATEAQRRAALKTIINLARMS